MGAITSGSPNTFQADIQQREIQTQNEVQQNTEVQESRRAEVEASAQQASNAEQSQQQASQAENPPPPDPNQRIGGTIDIQV